MKLLKNICLFCLSFTLIECSLQAGMLNDAGTGFFGGEYSEWERKNAPEHDFNNAVIRTYFIVDDVNNPKEFSGLISFGHAEKKICHRVSAKELTFIRSTLADGIWSDRHLGFGITTAHSEKHSSAIRDLYQWYTEYDTTDTDFKKYVKAPALVSKKIYNEEQAKLAEWCSVLKKENLIVSIELSIPALLEVGCFELEKTPNLSHLLLTAEEVQLIHTYISDILDPASGRLRDVALDVAKSSNLETELSGLQNRLDAIREDCMRQTETFVTSRKSQMNDRSESIINNLMKASLDANSAVMWCIVSCANAMRHALMENTEPSEMKTLFNDIGSRSYVVVTSGDSSAQERLCEKREKVDRGRREYQKIGSRLFLHMLPLMKRDEQDKRDDPEFLALVSLHMAYFMQLAEFLENISGVEDLSGGSVTYANLNEQQQMWLNTLYRQSLDFMRAYGSAANHSYFTEDNTAITVPLFMDALARGWPGDKLLDTPESQRISTQLASALTARFGKELNDSIIAQPHTCFFFSEDGRKGTVRQGISRNAVLAGMPAADGGRSVVALDRWNYAAIEPDQNGERIRTVPLGAALLAHSETCRSACEQIFAKRGLVFEHTDGRTVKAYYGNLKSPISSLPVKESSPSAVEETIAQLRKTIDFNAMQEFEKLADAAHADHTSCVFFEEHAGRIYAPGFGWADSNQLKSLIDKLPAGAKIAIPSGAQRQWNALRDDPEIQMKDLKVSYFTNAKRAHNNMKALETATFARKNIDTLNESELPELVLDSDDAIILNLRVGRNQETARADFTRKLQQALKRFPGKRIAVVVCEEDGADAKVWLGTVREQMLQNGATLVCLPSEVLSEKAGRKLIKQCEELKLELDGEAKNIGEFMDEALQQLRFKEKCKEELPSLPENFLFERWVEFLPVLPGIEQAALAA